MTTDTYLLAPEVEEFVRIAAPSGLPKLLLGETGTGKTLLARIIHERGPRARAPFLSKGCGTLSRDLVGDALFGHDKGAFTGAHDNRPGFLEAADGGTLVLNDLDALPVGLQPSLLDFLDSGETTRLGGTHARQVDVQLIVTLNRDPQELEDAGKLRSDLYYRLAVLSLTLPPLRSRKDEIPQLVEMLLWDIMRQGVGVVRNGWPRHRPHVSAAALDRLKTCRWPGNCRDLRSVLVRCLLASEGGEILESHVVDALARVPHAAPSPGTSGEAEPSTAWVPLPPEEERKRILTSLGRTQGNRTRAARLLGMSRQTLWIKIQRYGIEPDEWSSPAAPSS